jgi:prepilin-type N-terminal cleavage/methylation domain-containing protein
MMRGRRRSREAGFTMTELMVTVVILGILAALTVSTFKSQPVADSTRKVAAVIADARRRAVSGGPIRADVAAATGNRARAIIDYTNESGVGRARIYVAVEDPLPATTFQWIEVSGQSMPNEVEFYAIGSSPAIDPGGAVPAALGAGTVTKRFFADGTCDATTVYLRKSGSSDPNLRHRVFAMPLTCSTGMFKDW